MLLCVLHQRDAEGGLILGDDGEAGAVHGDGALDDAMAEDIRRRLIAGDHRVPLRREGEEGAGGFRHATDEVPGQAIGEGEGALKVHGIVRLELAQVGAAVGLRHAIEVERLPAHTHDRKVNAVDGDGVARVGTGEDLLAGDDETALISLTDGANLFDDAGEHGGIRVQEAGIGDKERKLKLDAILQRPGIVPDPLTEAAALGRDLADVEVVVGADTQEGVAQAKAGLTELGEGAVIGDYEVQIALAQRLKVLTGGVPDLVDARFNRPLVIGDAAAAGTEARLTD